MGLVSKYDRRITAGIQFLDAKFGRKRWLKKMDERKLDLAHGGVCMAGQLYEKHWSGFLDEMSAKHNTSRIVAQDIGEKYGFYINSEKEQNEGGYDILTRLWFSRISVLRIQAAMGVLTPPPISN